MSEEKEQMRTAAEDEMAKEKVIRPGPLDPLLKRLVTFTCMEELDHQLNLLVNKVDKNNDGTLTSRELNAGFRNLDYFDPPIEGVIYLSRDQYEALTQGILDDNKELTSSMFVFMIRRELERYMEKQLVKGISSADEAMLGALCGLKLLVSPITHSTVGSRATSAVHTLNVGLSSIDGIEGKESITRVVAEAESVTLGLPKVVGNAVVESKQDGKVDKAERMDSPIAQRGALDKDLYSHHSSSNLGARMTAIEVKLL